MEAALNLLESDQGKGVRMGDIAAEAGISRQALYLHFPTRSELLVATTRYLDDIKGVDRRLAASRNAETGVQRLDAFIEAWGSYIPEIYGVARALLAIKDTDAAAKLAWDDRMDAVRQGCAAAVQALKADGVLSPDHPPKQAADILWTILSVRSWELLTSECGWPQKRYIETTKKVARRILVADDGGS